MDRCVIFGAGAWGNMVFAKLSLFFNVIAYADNNEKLWGMKVNGVEVLPPPELSGEEFVGVKMFIANELHWPEIAAQLNGFGHESYVLNRTSFYKVTDGHLSPISFGKPQPYKKENRGDYAVLYVQDRPCVRTDRFACVMKERGVKTFLAYSLAPSKTEKGACYDQEYAFWNYGELLEFVNNSDFDLVHCSNTPDEFINVIIHSNKPAVHDCHDMTTVDDAKTSFAFSTLEYIANTQSDGLIYATELYKRHAIEKFSLDPTKILVIGNYPLSSTTPVKRHKKRSASDGKLHCVYEGGLYVGSLEIRQRDLIGIFKQLSDAGIYVHIYSSISAEHIERLSSISSYIQYEGNLSGLKLMEEMTQYDVGLTVFNIDGMSNNSANLFHLENASANKTYEYLQSGLPVATNVQNYAAELRQLGVGDYVDVSHNINEQLIKIKGLHVEDDVLAKNNLLVNAYSEKLLNFYKKVSGRKELI